MSSKLFLNIRIEPGKAKRLPLENINMEQQVRLLKQAASEDTNLPPDQLVLLFRGILLDDEATLTGAGLRPGVTVHVLKALEKVPPKQPTVINDSPVSLALAFKNAAKNPNYRSALQRLSRPEVLENIMAATPGLREDPVALAMVQDPELMSQMCDVSAVGRAMKEHPSLAEAAHYIVALVHEEAASANPGTSAPSAYSYTLDALSDEEDMESSQSSDSQPNTLDFNSAITSAQLAAALAAASASSSTSGAGGTSSAANAPLSGTPLITPEMFSQALGQAFAATSVGEASPASAPPAQAAPAVTGELTDLEATSRRLAEHLQQMHELGLRDDTLNLQALQATDWNVAEAINLVFSGVMADNEPDSLE